MRVSSLLLSRLPVSSPASLCVARFVWNQIPPPCRGRPAVVACPGCVAPANLCVSNAWLALSSCRGLLLSLLLTHTTYFTHVRPPPSGMPALGIDDAAEAVEDPRAWQAGLMRQRRLEGGAGPWQRRVQSTAPLMAFHGGPVMHGTVSVNLISYGITDNATQTLIRHFVMNWGTSPYMAINGPYSDSYGPGATSATFGSWVQYDGGSFLSAHN